MRVAFHLKIPVVELQERISSSEFIDWIHFLDMQETTACKQDLYLAQIAAEVRRTYTKYPANVKVTDFLLEEKKRKKQSSEEIKTIFMAVCGPDAHRKKMEAKRKK